MGKILIVRKGQWGLAEEDDYDRQVEQYRNGLAAVGADVEVVETAEEAETKIRNEVISSVIFNSRGAQKDAERIARTYPEVCVFIFTGLLPKGQVIWVPKGRLTGKAICQLVMR